jgi:hypothetical protein
VAPGEAVHWTPASSRPLPRVTDNTTLFAVVELGFATMKSTLLVL